MSLVSVIIPTKDNFDSLLLALESVLNQTYNNFEIIIINQNSKDPNYYSKKLESFPNTIVIHLSEDNSTNSFIVQQQIKSIGINASKGEWICFLEDSDYWYPNKLETQLFELSKDTNVLFSSSIVHIGNGIYHPSKPVSYSYRSNSPIVLFKKSLGHTNYVYSSSVIIHRSISNHLKHWFDLLDHTDCLYISTPLLYKSI